jgi:hypothetical protein
MTSGNRGLGFIVAALFGALAVGQARPFSAAASSASSKDTTSAAASSSTALGEEPEDPPRAAPPAGPDCSGGERLFDAYEELYGEGTFRYLLALVPDPEESGHTDYFDAVLEGVEDAIA